MYILLGTFRELFSVLWKGILLLVHSLPGCNNITIYVSNPHAVQTNEIATPWQERNLAPQLYTIALRPEFVYESVNIWRIRNDHLALAAKSLS